MNAALFRRGVSLWLLSAATIVNAADELAVQVSTDDPASTLTLVLDGGETETVDGSGLAYFDLVPGAHSLQVLAGDESLYSFRFNSASGQMADAYIRLSAGADPVSGVDTYSTTETAAQRATAATGQVEGQISSGGAPVAGAKVELAGGVSRTVTTDASGRYSLQAPRGIYTLTISEPGLGSQSTENFRVIGNVVKGSDFVLRDAAVEATAGAAPSGSIEEVLVLATMSGAGLQLTERDATNVINTIDIEQLARFGDTDVGSSVIRVPSVTVQDNQFVFIRGLGDRYVTSTLNGATLPGTNPSRRSVPLDLFPSSIVEQLDIRKSFIASMPGESTGGNLVINTRTFPDDRSGKLSAQLGYVDGITFDDALTDSNEGDWDFLGWDDGTRHRPVTAWAVAQTLEFTDFLPPSAQRELGKLGANDIKDNFNFDEQTATPDISIGGSFGDLFYLDRWDMELGYFISGNYKNEWGKRSDGISRTYSGVDASRVEDDFTFEQYDNDVDANSLLSVGANVGQSSYTSNTIVSRVTSESVRVREGINGDENLPSTGWSIEWEERQFLSQQLMGEHVLEDAEDWTITWQGTASQATRDAPDRRDVRFDLRGDDGIYDLETAEVTRRYDDLVDNNYDGSVGFEYLFPAGDLESSLDAGINLISRDRDSDSDTYGFQGGLLVTDFNSPNLDVNDVINENTITGDPATGFTFQNKTLPSDSYEAEMDLNSVFISYDALWKLKYQMVLGVRYEDFEQTTETFELAGDQGEVTSLIEEDSILPSLTLNWFYADDEQLRFVVSQTVARPDFKETSNATFYDPEFDFRVRGNPNLEVSDIINYDLRWEKYWSDQESVSIALFYKDMDKPIERVVQPASGTAGNSRTYQNAETAEILGIEFDGRKEFPLDEGYTKSFFVAVNASYLDSEVTLLNAEQRELQGAPDYTANLIFGYDDINNGHELTLLLNQVGDTIVDVGVSGQPDIIQQPALDVNLIYKYALSDSITLRAKLENMLDSEVEFTQGGSVFQQYKKGFEIKVGFDWTF